MWPFQKLQAPALAQSATKIQRANTLQEDDPKAVEIMIQYFYAFDYEIEHDETPQDNGLDNGLLCAHSMVYAIADKYQVTDLKSLARTRFADSLIKGGVSIYHAVDHVFDSTPDTDYGLRDICLLSYAVSIHSEQESWDGGEGDLQFLIKACKAIMNKFPALSAEISTFALFSQAGLLRPKDVVTDKPTTGSEALLEDLLMYLSLDGDGSRAEQLRALVEKLGRTGW